MCGCCDCRTRPLLARLGEDHGRIRALVGTIERLAATGTRGDTVAIPRYPTVSVPDIPFS